MSAEDVAEWYDHERNPFACKLRHFTHVRGGLQGAGLLLAGELQWRAVKRRLFTILSAVSLPLSVAVVVPWVRSQWVTDTLGRHYEIDDGDLWGEQGSVWVSSDGGLRYAAYFDVSTDTPACLRSRPRDGVTHAPSVEGKPIGFQWRTASEVNYPYTGNTYDDPTGDTTLGFGAGRIENDLPTTTRGKRERLQQRVVELVVPYWFLTSASLLPMALWAISAYRSHRRSPPRRSEWCPSCGYDLRATPGR